MTYDLYIADRTFSSWSLRGWLMLEKVNLPWRNIFDPDHRRWDNRIVAYYGVRSIPNVKLFVNGEVVDEFVGAIPKAAINDFMDKALKVHA